MKNPHLKTDLNCDMGEVAEAIADGTQEALMRSITSANVACGGHAGDARTMETTIEQALRWKLAIGAHPGYPDRANFGRLELKLPVEAIADTVSEQVRDWPRLSRAAVPDWRTSSRTERFTIKRCAIASLRRRLQKASRGGARRQCLWGLRGRKCWK